MKNMKKERESVIETLSYMEALTQLVKNIFDDLIIIQFMANAAEHSYNDKTLGEIIEASRSIKQAFKHICVANEFAKSTHKEMYE